MKITKWPILTGLCVVFLATSVLAQTGPRFDTPNVEQRGEKWVFLERDRPANRDCELFFWQQLSVAASAF
jgi:hypothetical protein